MIRPGVCAGDEAMRITRYSDGTMKLHFYDDDNYDVTDDNGVDVYLTKDDIQRIRSTP